MENNKEQICTSLIEWFHFLNLASPHSTVEELSDGVAFAEALNQFASETFTDTWLSKIKLNVGSNWRLKVSNLKKVIEGLYDYYTDVLSFNLSAFPRPDAMKIAENIDMTETGRLLQLILGLAVNCTEKQNYITQIMEMEESLQQTIMKSLQDLEAAWQGATSKTSLSLLNFDIKILIEERDSFAQKCHEAEKKIASLAEEKSIIQLELIKVQKELQKANNPVTIGQEGVSLDPDQPGSSRYNELRKQVELLKEELMQSETNREDLKLKAMQQEQELKHLHQKLEDFTQNNSELSQLKDEVDILREGNEKLKIYESQLDIYKKKFEEQKDLKKQIKMLEDRNAEYVRQISEYEDDSNKYSTMKGQLELFKKEIQELHGKLDNEISRAAKLEFENKNFESTITALQRANKTLLNERDTLRETVDELRCTQTSYEGNAGNTVSKELQTPELIQRIERLESENKVLREGHGGQTALTVLLDESNKRYENLREQLHAANERIILLTTTAKGDEYQKMGLDKMELKEQKGIQLDEPDTQISNLQNKLNQTECLLASREHELIALETKYKKCVEKAKEVIKSMDPRITSVIDTNLFEKMGAEGSENKTNITLLEGKLMASAFYSYGVKVQREAIDAKLSLLMGQGQSFLARHRQSTPRKKLNYN